MIPSNVEMELLRLTMADRLPEVHDLAAEWAAHDGIGAVDALVVRLVELLDVLGGVAA